MVLSISWYLKRNPQPSCAFVFLPHFSLTFQLCATQPYSIYYFFIFNFIYIRYAYTHGRTPMVVVPKVAGYGLRIPVLGQRRNRSQLFTHHGLHDIHHRVKGVPQSFSFVIQSKAKDLGNIHLCYPCFVSPRSFLPNGRLDDTA